MEDFWKNLAALFKVKTIVTLVVIAVFAALALLGGCTAARHRHDHRDHGRRVLFRHPEREGERGEQKLGMRNRKRERNEELGISRGRSGLARNTKFVRRGGIYPARGALRRGGVPGPMRASAPTGVTAVRGSRLTAVFPRLCRAGVHARRTAAIQNRGVCASERSGGMRASRPTSARRGTAVPLWPETQNLFVGAGFIPPAKPCGGAWPPGRCKHRPLQGFVVWQGRNFPVGRGARRRS